MVFDWLRDIRQQLSGFRSGRRRSSVPRKARRSLRSVQALESRVLLSAAVVEPSALDGTANVGGVTVIQQDFDDPGSAYQLIEPVTPGNNGVTSGGPSGDYFRLNGTTSNSSKDGQPDLLLFDDTLSLAGQAFHAQFDYRETIHTNGGAEGVRFTLYPAD
jgi:hypothetical protein